MEDLTGKLDELYNEFEDRVKNVFTTNYSSGDILDFNIKILTNSKRWYNQSMKDILGDVKNKFEKWHYDIQKTFDSLKYSY
jgi:hypothetical protein